MATEVNVLKHSTSDYRFFFRVVPDLQGINGLSASNGLEMILFTITLAFALLNTLWIAQDLCESTCPRIFQSYKYLQIALYLFESLFVISGLVMMYLKRSLGVEGVEKIVQMLNTKEIEEEDEDDEPEYKDPYSALYRADGEAAQEDSEEESGDDDESLFILRLAQSSAEEHPKPSRVNTK